MHVKLLNLIKEDRFRINNYSTQLVDNLYNHMRKYIKTRGSWDSIEKNIHDILHIEDGVIKFGNTNYSTLESL